MRKKMDAGVRKGVIGILYCGGLNNLQMTYNDRYSSQQREMDAQVEKSFNGPWLGIWDQRFKCQTSNVIRFGPSGSLNPVSCISKV